jgi:hypothetical protein
LSLAAAVLVSFGATVHTHLAIASSQRERADFDLRLLRLAEQFRESVRSALRVAPPSGKVSQTTRLVLESSGGASIAYEFRDGPARLTISGTGPEATRDEVLLLKGCRGWFELRPTRKRHSVTIVVECPRGRKAMGAHVETRIVAFPAANSQEQ